MDDSENKTYSIGSTVPDFTLPDTGERMVTLSMAARKGRVVLVFYRGSW
jgi:peroxiredoxin